ncbi:unnamed protein product [Miscanthus lutarioriparius]|uniref:UBC core domain-containing protein n=1 Tax=Miscanthus lutarioriparius TaxID=422564 RepID=A0A811RR80_9POAL|nr:unnamed protein product [Miscanthus lutarioriparius]
MDAAGYPHMQGSGSAASSSCRAADYSAGWDSAQQQKRQRCQGSSNDQVGSSTENNSLEAPGFELKFDYGKNEEEDYYFEDEDDGCVEATVPWLQKVERDGPGKFKSMSEIEEEIAKKYNFFKQFDTVEDFIDHKDAKNSVGNARKEWAKRIQHKWSLLEKDLPALIYVRVSENRMDLLRAVMIGPQGTPYHDGLFFFDAHFLPSYPTIPPVSIQSLSVWWYIIMQGKSCEKWNPAQSAMLQVLISIQALVLNEKPFYNELGYERYANSAEGLGYALDYNDTAFQYSCRTMLYSLRKPPQHFEDLVVGHLGERGHAILAACKYYMEGHEVGSKVPEEDVDTKGCQNGEGSSCSTTAKPQQNKPALRTNRNASFKTNLEVLFEELLMEFNVKGANTARFRAEKLKNQLAAA